MSAYVYQMGVSLVEAMHSPIQAKIALFRRLFQGRRDAFPVRWENVKSGRNGCSPACRNKWRRGVCNGR